MRKRFEIRKAKSTPPPPGEMSEMDVSMISLVRKGANKQKVQIYKEDEENEEPVSEEKGFFNMLKEYFTGEKIEKADTKTPQKTFAGIMAVADITENMWRVNDTLRTVMRDICNNPEVKDKKAALNQAVDEFSAYMKEKINGSKIAKADYFNEPEIQEDDEVKKEDLTKIVKAAIEAELKPINEKIAEIEKADGIQENAEDNASEAEAALTEIIKTAVSAAVKPISERLTKVEKSREAANSQAGGETSEVHKADEDEDIFGDLFI